MRSEELKQKVKKIKEKTKEGQKKIKSLVIKRKDDFLTALEKNWRDWLFKPLTDYFKDKNITANQISYAGFGLIFIAFLLYLIKASIGWQLFFIALATFSDMIDGPTARNNKDVTVLGTWLDHTRDYTIVAWVTYLLYTYKILGIQLIAVLWGLQLLLIWALTRDFLIKYLKGLSTKEEQNLIKKFSLDNLQASIIGRLQFAFWIGGYISFIIFLMYQKPIFISLGNIGIILAIIFAALNISEGFSKSI